MSEPPFESPYPDYDVLKKRDSPSWNEQTRNVVDKRVRELPERRFFDQDEWRLLEAVCARLLPQPERGTHAIPIVPFIDQKLAEQKSDGTRYGDQPPMQQAWRRGLRGLEQEVQLRFQQRFEDLAPEQQDEVLRALQRGEVRGDAWAEMSASRFFSSSLLGIVVSIYYAHPWSWNEIGFGGPASPRGYARLDANQLDPWEAVERRPPRGSR